MESTRKQYFVKTQLYQVPWNGAPENIQGNKIQSTRKIDHILIAFTTFPIRFPHFYNNEQENVTRPKRQYKKRRSFFMGATPKKSIMAPLSIKVLRKTPPISSLPRIGTGIAELSKENEEGFQTKSSLTFLFSFHFLAVTIRHSDAIRGGFS